MRDTGNDMSQRLVLFGSFGSIMGFLGWASLCVFLNGRDLDDMAFLWQCLQPYHDVVHLESLKSRIFYFVASKAF